MRSPARWNEQHLAWIVGVGILATSTAMIIDSSQASGAHAWLLIALACGTAIGGVVVARANRMVQVCVATALVCGEAYGMLATAERILAAREAQQSPAREARRLQSAARERVRIAEDELTKAATASVRLSAAIEAKQVADSALTQKASGRGCADNCRLLLQGAVRDALQEVEAARSELYGERRRRQDAIAAARREHDGIVVPSSGSVLADRIGLSSWIVDLVQAGLLTLGANGLAAVLIFWGAHGRLRRGATGRDDATAATSDDIAQSEMSRHRTTERLDATALDKATAAAPTRSDKRTAVATGRVAPRQATTNVLKGVIAFLEASCEFDDGTAFKTNEADLLAAYRAWCRRKRRSAGGDGEFVSHMSSICAHTHVTQQATEGATVWIGVRLREKAGA